MLKERSAIVAGITSHLKPAETNIDLALASLASLNGHLPAARASAGVAMEVGHGAIEAFGEAQALILKARAKVIEGHRELARTQKAFRFPEIANGGLGDKDPQANLQVPRGSHLAAVSSS